MIEKLNFAADAALVSRLGRELVAKQETALIELIKNGFDADATETQVVLLDGAGGLSLTITDNGTGMTRTDLVDGYLRLASDLKVQAPRSPKYGRQRAGRKGIGRFATQRLGDRLVLTTKTEGARLGLRLTVNWDDFVRGKTLTAIDVLLEEIPIDKVGTSLAIERLYDEWTDAQIKRCWRGVLGLQQPFPVAPISQDGSVAPKDPGFSVKFIRSNELLHDELVVADLQTEILDHLHAIVEMRVSDEGLASWRLSKNRFGSERDWQAIHHDHAAASSPPAYAHLKNVWMKAYYVILAPDLLPSLVYTRIRDELADQGGIRLYRNGFRVVPYGDSDNDWLRLDEMYVKRSFLAPLANRNFFGVVEVRDPDGELYEEHTSREGLIETPAFSELRNLASAVLVTAATRISEDRGRKPKAGGATSRGRLSLAPQESLTQVRDAIKATEAAVRALATDGHPKSASEAIARAEEASRLVETTTIEVASAEAQMADEAAILRFLATLGMTIAEFSHETGMTFDAFRLDFESVFEAARSVAEADPAVGERATRARNMLARLDTLTSYLNSLAAARSARGMYEVSLSKMVEDFERGIKLQAAAQGVTLSVETPAYDPLFTQPMHEAEVASILLNLYTNSVKAIKRTSGSRRVLIQADRLQNTSQVRLRVSDSGDGIPAQNRERIFDAFFTTSAAPPAGALDTDHAKGTGLGLWIVSQIVSNSGGEIFVGEAADSYATCIEVHLLAENTNVN